MKNLAKSIERAHQRLSDERDKLREIIDQAEASDEAVEAAMEGLQQALDALGELP